MAKEHIEKTLIILEEEEVRQLFHVAQQNDQEEIQRFMMIFIKKVEAALRRRCG
jgi:hypothetical protein